MIFAYIILFALFFIDCKPQFIKNGINERFLEKEQTLPIKGVFVLLVFFRHFRGYVDMDYGVLNHLFVLLDSRFSQLIVTMFFFYSGYGIFEQIKKNKSYADNFITHRILPTYINFAFCVLIYFLLCIIRMKGNFFSMQEIILSFVGWKDCFGNSNWFMFVTFCIYILLYVSFLKKWRNDRLIFNIVFFNFLTIGLAVILFIYKKHYWYNTLFCFNLGIWYSNYKQQIESFLKISKNYAIIFVISVISFLLSFFLIETQSPLFIIKALLFTVLFVLCQMKFLFTPSKIYSQLGKHIFSVYMLQRIPFILLTDLALNKNIYLFFIGTLISTIAIATVYDCFIVVFSKCITKLRTKLFH